MTSHQIEIRPQARPARRAAGAGATGRGLGGFRRLGVAVVSVVVVFVAWFALAPPQLGGSTSYVITSGISMLPRFHAGDVVVLRRESSYHVGEVAAYHNQQLGVVVMHRIVAIDHGRYLFKGDNNDFSDTYQPTKAQIVGAEWLHLPGAGRYVLEFHTPVVGGVALGLLWLASLYQPAGSRRQRRRHRHGR